MNMTWNKKDVNKYKIKCGNFTFYIKTHLKQINESAFDQIKSNPDIPYFDIAIWIDKDVDMEYMINCKKKGIEFIPSQIINFYRILDQYNLPHIPMNNRINQFFDCSGDVFARFPYITDEFYLYYQPKMHEIFVVGDEATLERIIVDFLSVTAQTLPLHGGCISIDNKSFLILGESRSGKSSIILKLIDLGAEYIANDILFIYDDEVIRQGTYVGMRNNFLPKKLKALESNKRSENYSYFNIFEMEKKLGYHLGNRSRISDIFMIHPMNYWKLESCQLFPMIPHESMWCMDVLNFTFKETEKYVKTSKDFYFKLLKRAHSMNIDFNDFDDYSEKIYHHLLDSNSS